MPSDPASPGGYAMDKNHLHIWPRHAFMLIGLPNKVRVFFSLFHAWYSKTHSTLFRMVPLP